jgi:hypothetical protein
LKIAAGIVEYGDAEGLQRCLTSLNIGKGGFDLAIVVHRRFDHFDLNDQYHYQNTLTVVNKWPNGSIYLGAANEADPNTKITQVEARNEYMQKAGELGVDWLLVIDSDEFVLPNADWKEFRRQLEYIQSLKLDDQIFDIEFYGSISDSGGFPRLFLYPGSVRYWIKHYWFVCTTKQTLYKGVGDAGRIVTGIALRHSKIVRTMEHIQATQDYYVWQEKIEQPTPEQIIEVPYQQIARTQFNMDKWEE